MCVYSKRGHRTLSESAGAITIGRTSPSGTLSNTAIVGKSDNPWATNDGKTIAAAFSADVSAPGGRSTLVISIVHKLGDIVTTYSALPDGTPGLLVVTTVYKRGEPGGAPLTAIPHPDSAVQRLQQVFGAAK